MRLPFDYLKQFIKGGRLPETFLCIFTTRASVAPSEPSVTVKNKMEHLMSTTSLEKNDYFNKIIATFGDRGLQPTKRKRPDFGWSSHEAWCRCANGRSLERSF